jgi:hypothetical protein
MKNDNVKLKMFGKFSFKFFFAVFKTQFMAVKLIYRHIRYSVVLLFHFQFLI